MAGKADKVKELTQTTVDEGIKPAFLEEILYKVNDKEKRKND